jgi:hypothetical protein
MMPARTNSTMTKPAVSATGKRFELPALDFKFGSLTEGTDIPPPPPSPVREAAVPAAPATKISSMLDIADKAKAPVANGKTNVSPDPSSPISVQAGTKRPATDYPASPTSTRPGSIRRLFSRSTLNKSYQDGEKASEIQRPESRLSIATTTTDAKKTKRSSGWFSRLRSSDNVGNKRITSSVPMSPTIHEEKKKPSGPPPPMIPELKKVNQGDGGLGDDLFKDIK